MCIIYGRPNDKRVRCAILLDANTVEINERGMPVIKHSK